jgi:hypothetical protein
MYVKMAFDSGNTKSSSTIHLNGIDDRGKSAARLRALDEIGPSYADPLAQTHTSFYSGFMTMDAIACRFAVTLGLALLPSACSGGGVSGMPDMSKMPDMFGVSFSNTFSPNATTISTSEGAPYGNCDFWVSGPCSKQSQFGYGPTKVMRIYICLSGEVSTSSCSQQPAVTGPLSTTMLSDIASRLSAYASTGMRLIVRFTYNFGPIGSTAMDAPLSVILQHIDQVAPILLQDRDLIVALEAGFIGTWGEWHDSTNGNDTAAAQKAVLDKEQTYFNGVFPVLVRYPGDLLQYTGNSTPPSGFGLHDDYYDSDSDDGATWNPCDTNGGYCLSGETAAELQSYAAAVSQNTMFVGEFGALDASMQTCAALDTYSYIYNVQSITLSPYPTTIGTELQTEGCALSFYNKVGTRIELQHASISGNATAGGQLQVAITLSNTGYGRVIRPRPATLVFIANGTAVAQLPIPLTSLDLRQLAAAAAPMPQTFQFMVTLPAGFPSSGAVSAALLIPDPAPSLSTQPAYALPLNSVDSSNNPVYNPATGYNMLGTFMAG